MYEPPPEPTITELRKNAVAALAMLVVVSLGAMLVMVLL
jgi:hypothetical protein